MKSSFEKILVFRALKLGDMLCSIPALRALRNTFPTSHIALVSHPQMEDLFKRYSHYVDDFIPFAGFPGMPESPCDPELVLGIIQAIQKEKFDLAIGLHGSGELSNSVVSLFNAKMDVGHYRPGLFRPNSSYQIYPDDLHEIDRCLKILETLGVDSASRELEFPLTSEDYCELRDRYSDYSLLSQRPFICLHPGASTESKRWSIESFVQLGDWLADKGFHVAFTGSAMEADLVDTIRSLMRNKSFDAASVHLPLPLLGALISRSVGLVCNDTGVSHLASALKVPSVVIFIETSPQRWAPLNQEIHQWLWRPSVEDVQKKVSQFLMEEEFVS